MKLITEKELKDACLLILLNKQVHKQRNFKIYFSPDILLTKIFFKKQDTEDCLTIEEITDKFSLYKLCCGRSWHIQACNALNGTGLTDGLDWLSRQLVASGVHDLG